jgi:hypothetical protein
MKLSKIILLTALPLIALTSVNQVAAINCEVKYAGWCAVCRNLPEKPKVTRALC